MSNRLLIWLQYVWPKLWLTRLAGWAAARRGGAATTAVIRWFVRRYGVDMGEAAEPDPAAYTSFNDFFTRALRAGFNAYVAKPVDPHELKVRLHVASRIISYTTHIEKLESFIPICSYCKKVRDDKNYWQQIEMYINDRTGSEFSHSICPGCYTAHITPQLEALRAKPVAKVINPGEA